MELRKVSGFAIMRWGHIANDVSLFAAAPHRTIGTARRQCQLP